MYIVREEGANPMEASIYPSLRFDPLPVLKAAQDQALQHFVHRDLLDEPMPPITSLWTLPEPLKLCHKQCEDGSWSYPGKIGSNQKENYSLLETYRNLRILVEMYGFSNEHSVIEKAAGYIFGCLTAEGDIRGIIGNQYMPYYHGAILELLIKAGFSDDQRVIRGLDWLLMVRQEDGGWIVPAQAVPSQERTPDFWTGEPVQPERSKSHAHLATGMVLRAFASHPTYKSREEVIAAGGCLKGRLFKADTYNDRKDPSYWLKFQYPFWWTSLLTAVDTLSKLGYTRDDQQFATAVDWFSDHQEADGLWPTGYGAGQNAERNRLWVGLAICRVLALSEKST